MEDVTFIIHTRIDSKERLANFTFCINFLQKNFDSPIIVVEEDRSSKISGWGKHVKHIFIKSYSTLFNRTRPVNVGVKYAMSKFLCLLDMDVFTDPWVYVKSREFLDDFDVVYPFNGWFYDIKQHLNKKPDLRMDHIAPEDMQLLNIDSVGGMQFIRRDVFMKGGMTNELILGWGYEDNEFYARFSRLGYFIKRMNLPIYHFSHPRSFNSNGKSPLIAENEAIYKMVNQMSREEIMKYIDNEFYWCK
jgi:predicted glycosyltransferase involved in capsule biosynthesis